MRNCLALAVLPLFAGPIALSAPVEPLPFKVPARMPDAAQWLSPSAVKLEGYLGARVANNEK
ncbi:MAG: hypothetical protein NTX50_02385 [Candidatus Sumerlaeota bacterium]|nr:hypothetical protein [Candidatus Sumerlaeota bacterium]